MVALLSKALPNLLMVCLGLFLAHSVFARDLGVMGETFAITEPDLLEMIAHKLNHLAANGQMATYQRTAAKRVRAHALRPPALHVTRAIKTRTFYYDPSITLTHAVRDEKGRVLVAKGRHINPLDTVRLSKPLLFLNGDDNAQRVWARARLASNLPAIVILTGGAIDEAAKQWGRRVYFDQSGRLTRQLGIKHVPASVIQAGKRLQVTEVALDE